MSRRARRGMAGSIGGSAAAASDDPLGFGFSTNAPNLSSNFTQTAVANGVANWTTYSRLSAAGYAAGSIRVKISASSGNVCASFHGHTGSGLTTAPGTRLATTGSIPCPSVGIATMALDVSATPTLQDYVAWGTDNTTASAALGAATVAASSTMTEHNGKTAVENTFPAPAAPSPAATSPAGGSLRGVLMIGV